MLSIGGAAVRQPEAPAANESTTTPRPINRNRVFITASRTEWTQPQYRYYRAYLSSQLNQNIPDHPDNRDRRYDLI